MNSVLQRAHPTFPSNILLSAIFLSFLFGGRGRRNVPLAEALTGSFFHFIREWLLQLAPQ
jgi:hypothetical protein